MKRKIAPEKAEKILRDGFYHDRAGKKRWLTAKQKAYFTRAARAMNPHSHTFDKKKEAANYLAERTTSFGYMQHLPYSEEIYALPGGGQTHGPKWFASAENPGLLAIVGANPAMTCWNCGLALKSGEDICPGCWAGQSDENPRMMNCPCGGTCGGCKKNNPRPRVLYPRMCEIHGCKRPAAHDDELCRLCREAVNRAVYAPMPSEPFPASAYGKSKSRKKRRKSNPTDMKKRGNKGYVKMITLGQLWEIAKKRGEMNQFYAALKAHKLFHKFKARPQDYVNMPVKVFRKKDGKKGVTTKIGSVSGLVPETHYHKVMPGSNKANTYWVHKHPPGGEPTEIWFPLEQVAMKVGGTMRRTDWYRD